MKQFFKMFFATLLAMAVAFFLFLMVFIGGLSKGSKVANVAANSVLNLTLKGEITDRAYNNPFRNLTAFSALTGNITDQSTIGLYELKDVLKYAKTDDHIKGIYLNLDDIESAPANLFELEKSLQDFKSSGKFVYAYSASSSEKNVLLNNVADKYFINPLGECEFDGF